MLAAFIIDKREVKTINIVNGYILANKKACQTDVNPKVWTENIKLFEIEFGIVPDSFSILVIFFHCCNSICILLICQ